MSKNEQQLDPEWGYTGRKIDNSGMTRNFRSLTVEEKIKLDDQRKRFIESGKNFLDI